MSKKGWRNEPIRHSLSSKGIETKYKSKAMAPSIEEKYTGEEAKEKARKELPGTSTWREEGPDIEDVQEYDVYEDGTEVIETEDDFYELSEGKLISKGLKDKLNKTKRAMIDKLGIAPSDLSDDEKVARLNEIGIPDEEIKEMMNQGHTLEDIFLEATWQYADEIGSVEEAIDEIMTWEYRHEKRRTERGEMDFEEVEEEKNKWRENINDAINVVEEQKNALEPDISGEQTQKNRQRFSNEISDLKETLLNIREEGALDMTAYDKINDELNEAEKKFGSDNAYGGHSGENLEKARELLDHYLI